MIKEGRQLILGALAKQLIREDGHYCYGCERRISDVELEFHPAQCDEIMAIAKECWREGRRVAY